MFGAHGHTVRDGDHAPKCPKARFRSSDLILWTAKRFLNKEVT